MVDFWAPWCRNCTKLDPTILRMASENVSVKVVKVNVQAAETIAAEMGAGTLPMIQFYRNGAKIGQHVGADSGALAAAFRSVNV